MKKLLLFAACVLALAACNKMPDPNNQADVKKAVRIAPVMTRVNATAFENGDAIGVTITRAAGAYTTNKQFTYNGLEFSSDLDWYAEGNDAATISAYYPYNSNGVPASFSVATNQSAGTSASDFVAAIKADVQPTASAVTMPFQHKLTKLVISVTNNAGYTLDAMVVKGAILSAVIADDFTATVDPAGNAADITAYKYADTAFEVILPPQTVALTVQLTASGNDMQQKLLEATLAAGKAYAINVVVNPAAMEVKLAGEISDWVDGGTLEADNNVPFEEHLDQGYFTYDGVDYAVAYMDDGKWWMAQNLAYVPEGLSVCSDLNNVTAGVYAPLQLNGDASAAEFTTNPAVVAANGYLYQAEVALGLNVGDLTSVAAAEALEGARGICPNGWHVPTIDDIVGLVGKAVSPIETNANAPYYNGSNGSIVKLNEDGFNMAAVGSISIGSNVATAGTFMGRMAGYDHLCSSMFCGSSYAGVTYNTANDETSGVKNLQFYGLMPMTNKATEADYTCNGTKVSYRIAGPLRCVRN